MSMPYPSDIALEQFVSDSARVGVGPPSDHAPHRGLVSTVFCGVLYLLKSGCQWSNAARGLPQLAYLLPVFPGNGASGLRPGQDSILEQV